MRIDGFSGLLGLAVILALLFFAYHAGKRGMLG